MNKLGFEPRILRLEAHRSNHEAKQGSHTHIHTYTRKHTNMRAPTEVVPQLGPGLFSPPNLDDFSEVERMAAAAVAAAKAMADEVALLVPRAGSRGRSPPPADTRRSNAGGVGRRRACC